MILRQHLAIILQLALAGSFGKRVTERVSVDWWGPRMRRDRTGSSGSQGAETVITLDELPTGQQALS